MPMKTSHFQRDSTFLLLIMKYMEKRLSKKGWMGSIKKIT